MPDAGCRVPDAGCQVPGAGCRMPDAGFKIELLWLPVCLTTVPLFLFLYLNLDF
jgi:hypothetical protein